MRLKTIQIKNYRSIEDISFELDPLDDKSLTYGLIGVNEAGKSSILKAMSLKDGLIGLAPKDFKDKTKPVELLYFYSLEDSEIKECIDVLAVQITSNSIEPDQIREVKLKTSFVYSDPASAVTEFEIQNLNHEEKPQIQELLKQHILNRLNKAIFWTAEERYLISQPINLAEFAASPDSISIPLKNCFALAGVSNIKERVDNLQNDSTEIEQLQTELGEKVTEHIQTVWPNHPIEITFLITSGFIHFHVKDKHAKGKAKTAEQRSDGFKQFISFLLTVSAENKNEELSNAVLLLDEPETHLHPQAQEFLLSELIKITLNKRNNIVFFATHSNYMIDKEDLSRNYRIKKDKDNTEKIRFDKKNSTYASVTYEVFGIPSSDYHNELYSKLHQNYQDEDPADDKREGIMNFDSNFLNKVKSLSKDRPWKGNQNQATLPTYIRNCIHHSDNGDTYTKEELKKSIELLRTYF